MGLRVSFFRPRTSCKRNTEQSFWAQELKSKHATSDVPCDLDAAAWQSGGFLSAGLGTLERATSDSDDADVAEDRSHMG